MQLGLALDPTVIMLFTPCFLKTREGTYDFVFQPSVLSPFLHPSVLIPKVGILCLQSFIQWSADSIESLQVFMPWPEDLNVF